VELDRDGRCKLDKDGSPVWSTRPCGAPLFEYAGVHSWSIAEYVKDKASGR
jgi:hypothetical protein